MSANIAVIYSGAGLSGVAQAIAGAAQSLSARVRVLRVPEGQGPTDHREATTGDLEWADGIAFGTPFDADGPSPELMRFLEQTEPLGQGDKLYDKVITTFTDEPERFAPNVVVHPIWDLLYQWGAVIVGPRAFELALDAHDRGGDTGGEPGGASLDAPGGVPNDDPGDHSGEDAMPGPRLRTARYRGRRLATLASLMAAERARRLRLEL